MIKELFDDHLKYVKIEGKRLPDISDLIDQVCERNIDPTVFLDIDEGDIPKAPNCVKFFTSRKFLNLKPLPRQLQICLHLFEEFCPVCSCQQMVNNMFDQSLPEILDKIQLLHFGVCPRCKKTKWDLHKEGHFNFPHNLAVCSGQRSGKSLLSANFILPYILHRYLTTGHSGIRISPQNYFGLLPTTILQITATALTVTKALELIWSPFTNTLKQAPWFQNYHEFLAQKGKEKGEPLYLEGSTFFFYAHKLITGGVSAPDFGKLRGPTRIAAVIDEVDFFDCEAESKKQTLSAVEICKSLTNSLRTVRNKANKYRDKRPNWLSGYFLEISSPSSINGKILRDVRKAQISENKRTLGYHFSTWEMNPDYTFEDFAEEFEDDPVKTWRDFGAVPPLAGDNPFFENVDVLKKSQRNEHQDLLSYTIKYHTDEFKTTTLYAEVKVNYVDNVPRLVTVDKGYSVNSFCIVLSHIEMDSKPVIDYIITVRPEANDKKARRVKINTHLMFEHAIKPILEALKITHVVYDRWESLDSISKIRTVFEIEADQYSLQPKNFEELIKPSINEVKGVSYPKALIDLSQLDVSNYSKDFGGVDSVMKQAEKCPVSTLFIQMLTVREVGKKIVKPLNGDDDAFRAFCLALVYLLNPDINWKFKGSGTQKRIRSGVRMGAVLGYSNRGGNRGSMVNTIKKIGRCVLANSLNSLGIAPRVESGNVGRIVQKDNVNIKK